MKVYFTLDGIQALYSPTNDSPAMLWNVQTSEVVRVFEETGGIWHNVEFNHDRTQILSAGADHSARIWDIETGLQLHWFGRHWNEVYDATFSPDENYILAASNESPKLWDINTEERIDIFQGRKLHWDWVSTVEFSPDGDYAVSGSWDGEIFLWNLNTGNILQEFWGHDDAVSTILFTPDGDYMISGSRDETIRLWDVNNGETLHIFEGHKSDISTIIFHPDHNLFLSGSTNGTIRLWNLETKETLRIFRGHSGIINDISVNAEGNMFVSSDSASVRLWDIDYRDFIEYSCSLVFRDLTDFERNQFSVDDTPTCPQFEIEN